MGFWLFGFICGVFAVLMLQSSREHRDRIRMLRESMLDIRMNRLAPPTPYQRATYEIDIVATSMDAPDVPTAVTKTLTETLAGTISPMSDEWNANTLQDGFVMVFTQDPPEAAVSLAPRETDGREADDCRAQDTPDLQDLTSPEIPSPTDPYQLFSVIDKFPSIKNFTTLIYDQIHTA
jgi:hypothetical protein